MASKPDPTTIADLTPDPHNARKHNPRNLGMVINALHEVGAARSIVIDENGVILAGNGVVEAAADAGIERVQVVDADGETIIAVRRSGLTDKQKTRLALLDNRAGELAEWDAEAIAADLEAGVELGDLFDRGELDEIMAGLGPTPEDKQGGVPIFSNDAIIDAAFTYFRRAGFPYRNLPVHVCMQEINALAGTETAQLEHTNAGYQVADTYHQHRNHSSAEGMASPVESFQSDKLLRRALALQLEVAPIPDGHFGVLNMVSGTQACANFRPGFALMFYRRYCEPDAVVLDCSTGYGGRLVGFMASQCGRYIGIDPNVPTHEGNLRMAAELGFADKVELYNLPAEDVDVALLRGRCDFAFTSPPYFAKEHYSEDATQSWVRYKTGDEWRDGFLLPTMRLQFEALKPGCYAVVNIADVNLRNKTYPLERWASEAGVEAGFAHVKTERFKLTRRFGAGMADEVATEPVLIFQKPAADETSA